MVAEPGSLGGCITGLLAGANLCNYLHKFLVRPVFSAVADLPFDGPGDGDPLGSKPKHLMTGGVMSELGL